MGANIYYYEVEINLPATWQNSVYTYSHDEVLSPGQIVKVPFGKATKVGFVTRTVVKPTIKTKPISEITKASLPAESLQLNKWLKSYYPGPPGAINSHFLPSLIGKTKDFKVEISKYKSINPPFELTDPQTKSLAEIKSSNKTSVLYGVTGSGKTRLYAEYTKEVLGSGKNVLILYPEISLSKQTTGEISRFIPAANIFDFHSKQTPTQQKKTWLAALNSTGGSVFTGPRSALFLPIRNLGLVIIDESHDSSYKQDSGTRYHGVPVAAALAKLHNAKLLLSSATPSVQETYQILSKDGNLVSLTETAKNSGQQEKEFTVVDMKNKENISTNHLLSKKLIISIKNTLKNGNQSLIFMNKRGTAKLTQCESCGWHAECPRCELPLTYHHDRFSLKCHVCTFSRKAERLCPDCSSDLSQKSKGVKALENDLATLFPEAKISRFDSDNKKGESMAANFAKIKDGEVDIIVGTQLISKGLDLPKLALVGVINADSALMLPDYTSEEKAFQQLMQVSGRVGRGHVKGEVVLQTYQTNSPLIKSISNQDWPAFYKSELSKRKISGFPPISFAIKIWTSRAKSEKAYEELSNIVNNLDSTKLTVLGPTPSFYEKSNGKYNWQIVILSKNRSSLVEIAKNTPKDFFCELDPVSFL